VAAMQPGRQLHCLSTKWARPVQTEATQQTDCTNL